MSRTDPLVDLVDTATHDAAVAARARRRELEERSAELATWTGCLHDLAERAAPVGVRLRSGRRCDGRLVAVALDHVVLAGAGPRTLLVALGAIGAVHVGPGVVGDGRGRTTGDRDPAQDRTLAEALAAIAEVDPRMTIGVAGRAEPLHGQVMALGEDVVTLGQASGGAVLVPTTAVTDVTWGGS